MESEAAAFQYVRDYLSFLPANAFDDAPVVNPGLEPEITPHDLELDSIVPDSDNMAYDMHEILLRIFDDGDVFEVGQHAGPAILTAFARVDGHPVGVIANQPMHMSGAIDNEASDKAARFVRFCDAFNTPLIFVVDTPGFLPGVEQEKGGIIKRGGRFLNAVVEADVPKVTLTIRKSYGGAYAVMGSKQLGADINLAWPTAEIAVMGGQGAVNILYRGEIKKAEEEGADVNAVRTKLANEYTYNVASPFLAAERGELDGVIEPAQTRVAVVKALRALRGKRASLPPKKHGNIPL